jgi:hypothetical protein
VLDRELHPEWGYLASGRSFVRTLRVVLIATAVGAVAGGGCVLWVSGGGAEDSRSVAARTLLPSEADVTAKPAGMTSTTGLPWTEQPGGVLPPAPAQSSPKTVQTKGEGGIAGAEQSSNTNLPPSQGDGLAETYEAPRQIGNLNPGQHGDAGSKSREGNRGLSRLADHTHPVQTISQPTAEREPIRNKPRSGREMTTKRSDRREARSDDVSSFFRPWWYAYPESDRRRNPG